MIKNEMEPFRYQLLKLERRLRGDVDTLADEAFHRTDGEATGNLSNLPVDDREELGSDNYCQEATIHILRARVRGWRKSTPPWSASTRGPSVVAKSAALKSRTLGFRPSPLLGSASSVPARHNKGKSHRRATCRALSVATPAAYGGYSGIATTGPTFRLLDDPAIRWRGLNLKRDRSTLLLSEDSGNSATKGKEPNDDQHELRRRHL